VDCWYQYLVSIPKACPTRARSLEALLAERLAASNAVGAPSDGYAALKIETEAHREVFDAFMHSFTTYRDVLGRIKTVYDVALDDALAAAFDNAHIKAELAMADKRMVRFT
jgi:hypothetical protein